MDVHMDAMICDRHLRSFDLSTLGSVLRVCHVELVLLDGQPPMASVTSFVHDQALLCTLEIAARTRGRFLLPVDWCLLGWMEAVDPETSWCHGVPLSPGGIISVMPDGVTEFALGANSRVTFVLVPLRRFQERTASRSLGGLDNGQRRRSSGQRPRTAAAAGLLPGPAAAHPPRRGHRQRDRRAARCARRRTVRQRPGRTPGLQPQPPRALPDPAPRGGPDAHQHPPAHLHAGAVRRGRRE